ncbi:glucose-6-phosphate isomerase [Candidatus Peregrinibacteria bacterium]|nr:glucose-6-phosphate isomerase [Candidatus Peregrinibacteria bacterium]
MLKLNYDKLSEINSDHGLSRKEIEAESVNLKMYLDKIKSYDLGFYSIIDDEKLLKSIENYASQIKGKFQNIVVLGIGGSSLGTICLQQSLKHLYQNELSEQVYPKLHVIDNIDPDLINGIEELLNLEQTLFIVVTKSGGTPETLSQFLYFREKVKSSNLVIEDHFVFVTDPEKGLLRELSNENPNIKTFEVPSNVGGRFSVLTAVGLLPAKLIGINIRALIDGAREMRDKFLSENFEQNLPFQMAAIQYLSASKKGKSINVTYPYVQKLIKLSDWYRQLLAESIGKELDRGGDKVNVGITPVHALGATDQHSQNQLYMEGPNDKLFIFITVDKHQVELEIPFEEKFSEKLGYLKDVSFEKLLKTEMQGTIDSLVNYNKPSIKLEIEKVDEKNLGELLMFLETATAFLGEFYNIDAFNQPGVEMAKNLTKKYLTKT